MHGNRNSNPDSKVGISDEPFEKQQNRVFVVCWYPTSGWSNQQSIRPSSGSLLVMKDAAMNAVQAYALAGNAYKAAWAASIAAAANPKTRSVGVKALSYMTRVSFNMARASAGAALSTPLAKGGSTTAGGMLGAVAGGYAAGAAIGTGVAYGIWGREGAGHALDFYTNPTGVDYFQTVGSAIKKTLE